MKTRAKRKLLPRSVLKEVAARESIGVPLTVIIKDLDLDISGCALRKLLTYYRASVHHTGAFIADSMFPTWLAEDKKIQTQPKGWLYSGVFPFGVWLYENN